MIVTVAAIIAAGTVAASGIAKLAFFIKARRREAWKQKQLDAIEVARAKSAK